MAYFRGDLAMSMPSSYSIDEIGGDLRGHGREHRRGRCRHARRLRVPSAGGKGEAPRHARRIRRRVARVVGEDPLRFRGFRLAARELAAGTQRPRSLMSGASCIIRFANAFPSYSVPSSFSASQWPFLCINARMAMPHAAAAARHASGIQGIESPVLGRPPLGAGLVGVVNLNLNLPRFH